MKKRSGFLFVFLVLFAWCAGASETDRPSEFMAGAMIVQTNPVAYGAEFGQAQHINNWTDNPGMEPLEIREYWEPTGVGSDAQGDYVICNTRKYDSIDSGFLDGAHYRLYREDMTEGSISKIREGTIPVGGYIAAGYMNIGNGAIKSYAPNTEATDDFWIKNDGQVWYYAVMARDVEGNWSDFSAAVSGVVPTNGIANGARIKTQMVSDPVVGSSYSTTLTALGGTLPLTWSIASGALPSGISLSAAGVISGTTASSAEANFTVQVTDSASETHDRIFTMFRPDPAGDGLVPAAPANVVVEANDSFVHVRWDAPAETDINYYVVYRSRQPEAEHMERIYLGGTGPAPMAEDLLFVEMEVMNAPPEETRSIRIIQYQGETRWISTAAAMTQEFEAHPGTLPVQFQNENPGKGCLKLSDANDEKFGIFIYKVGGIPNNWWRVAQLLPGHTYRMECWVYGEGLSDYSLHFKFPHYTDQKVTGIVNGEWTKLSVDFEVTEWITNSVSIFGPSFYFEGPGTVYLDNVLTYDINDPQGSCHYTKNVFDLWSDYVGPTNLSNKGVMRVRYNTQAFDHIMNPAVMSMRDWNLTHGAISADAMHIHDVFLEALASGTNAATRTIPWVIASLEWAEEDFVKLVEYLSGPAGTPYGDLRIEKRGGVTTPWTDEFRKIYIEMGNEPWNTGYFFGFRGGFSDQSGTTYGRWSNYVWDHVWDNSLYMSDVIKPVVGTWNSKRAAVGFTANAIRECPHSKHASMTMYLGGWEAGQEGQIGGTTWSDDGVQQWPVFLDRAGVGIVEGSVDLQEIMADEGRPFDWLIYEGGPSYMMNGLNGVSLTPEEQATSKKYGRTLAAGIGTLDYYMYGQYRGMKENAYFGFAPENGLWASHNYIQDGHLPHPAFLATMLYNLHVSPASMLLTVPLSGPTFDLEYEKDGAMVVKPDMNLASGFAFRDGDRYLALFLNKKVDGEHNGYDFGDGSTPASIHLPFTNPGAITLYKISGDPRETNMDVENFQIVTQSISTATFAQQFAVNETTGGVSNGLPVGGIYLYEFTGCTPNALVAPKVFVNQAVGQDDPAAETPVEFTVVFDQPVSGFDASDIVQSGAATATEILVEDVDGLGAAYRVLCDKLVSTGDLAIEVLAGAATSVESGLPNVDSISTDNQVQIRSVPLAEWEFDVQPTVLPKSALNQNPRLISAKISTGSGLVVSENQTGAFRVGHFEGNSTLADSISNEDYMALTLDASDGNGIYITKIYLHQWRHLGVSGDTIQVYVQASTNGFVTRMDLGSFDGATGPWGLPADVFIDVDVTAPIGHSLEFRFYLTETISQATAWGVGNTTTADGLIDIRLTGSVFDASPLSDVDSDGLPDNWEVTYYGNPVDGEPATSASNTINTVGDAYVAGFSPLDPNAAFVVAGIYPSALMTAVSWDTVSGRVYSVQWTSNLLSGFQFLTNNLPWTQTAFTDQTHSAEAQGFYKLAVELEP